MTPKAQEPMLLGHRIERERGFLRTNFASSRGQTMGKVTTTAKAHPHRSTLLAVPGRVAQA